MVGNPLVLALLVVTCGWGGCTGKGTMLGMLFKDLCCVMSSKMGGKGFSYSEDCVARHYFVKAMMHLYAWTSSPLGKGCSV